jgi:tRNA modification GTPase
VTAAIERDTIAALATPPGVGGVGILRLSGPDVPRIAEALLGRLPEPRLAMFATFRDHDGDILDQGLALYFHGPHSFTGEDVLELHGHGGPVVLDLLLQRVLALGARLARPGEFSERAFLEGKLDLTQAEAIADLIESGTHAQARLASRTLRGDFSRRIDLLQEALTRLRAFIEAALDFPDEDIDFIADSAVQNDLTRLIEDSRALLAAAQRGERVRDGLLLVIAGAPNAGKSSLLNALSGEDTAIVTDIPGTTRDVLRADIQIDGLPLRVVDTAGLRIAADPIEREGIRRAREQLEHADHVLWIVDDAAPGEGASLDPGQLPDGVPITLIRNKIDLTGLTVGIDTGINTGIGASVEIRCSVRDGRGLDLLRAHLKAVAGYSGTAGGEFSARRRHLDALRRMLARLAHAQGLLMDGTTPEIAAEELRLAQRALGEITGDFTSDDLLGRIFSDFCIGK